MADKWNRPVRKSPRLKGYDYRQEGAYFVTICTHRRVSLFGEVSDDEMLLNPSGKIAADCWEQIPSHFRHIELDYFVVMPNHVHGILLIIDQPSKTVAASSTPNASIKRARGTAKGALNTAIGSYKSAVTRQIRQQLQTDDTPIWQYSFHDHIIRGEASLNHIRQYVLYNPALWQEDRFYADK